MFRGDYLIRIWPSTDVFVHFASDICRYERLLFWPLQLLLLLAPHDKIRKAVQFLLIGNCLNILIKLYNSTLTRISVKLSIVNNVTN